MILLAFFLWGGVLSSLPHAAGQPHTSADIKQIPVCCLTLLYISPSPSLPLPLSISLSLSLSLSVMRSCSLLPKWSSKGGGEWTSSKGGGEWCAVVTMSLQLLLHVSVGGGKEFVCRYVSQPMLSRPHAEIAAYDPSKYRLRQDTRVEYSKKRERRLRQGGKCENNNLLQFAGLAASRRPCACSGRATTGTL